MKGPGRRADLQAWRRRFKRGVRDRLLPRLDMALMLGAVALSGLVANHLLHRQGLAMHWRYPLTVLAGYLLFFVLVRLWIGIAVAGSGHPDLQAPQGLEPVRDTQPRPRRGEIDVSETPNAAELATEGGEAAVEAAGGLDLDEGAVLVLFGALLLGVFAAGGWLVWQAPAILSEAAFSAVFASALRRARPDADHWVQTLLRSTILPFLAAAALAWGAGVAAASYCEGAQTLRQAVACETDR